MIAAKGHFARGVIAVLSTLLALLLAAALFSVSALQTPAYGSPYRGSLVHPLVTDGQNDGDGGNGKNQLSNPNAKTNNANTNNANAGGVAASGAEANEEASCTCGPKGNPGLSSECKCHRDENCPCADGDCTDEDDCECDGTCCYCPVKPPVDPPDEDEPCPCAEDEDGCPGGEDCPCTNPDCTCCHPTEPPDEDEPCPCAEDEDGCPGGEGCPCTDPDCTCCHPTEPPDEGDGDGDGDDGDDDDDGKGKDDNEKKLAVAAEFVDYLATVDVQVSKPDVSPVLVAESPKLDFSLNEDGLQAFKELGEIWEKNALATPPPTPSYALSDPISGFVLTSEGELSVDTGLFSRVESDADNEVRAYALAVTVATSDDMLNSMLLETLGTDFIASTDYSLDLILDPKPKPPVEPTDPVIPPPYYPIIPVPEIPGVGPAPEFPTLIIPDPRPPLDSPFIGGSGGSDFRIPLNILDPSSILLRSQTITLLAAVIFAVMLIVLSSKRASARGTSRPASRGLGGSSGGKPDNKFGGDRGGKFDSKSDGNRGGDFGNSPGDSSASLRARRSGYMD